MELYEQPSSNHQQRTTYKEGENEIAKAMMDVEYYPPS